MLLPPFIPVSSAMCKTSGEVHVRLGVVFQKGLGLRCTYKCRFNTEI